MKKITLVAAFSFFFAVASYAQTDNKDAGTPAATFQKVSSTVQPQQQSTDPKTDSKEVNTTAAQGQSLQKMVKRVSVGPTSANPQNTTGTTKVEPINNTIKNASTGQDAAAPTVTPK